MITKRGKKAQANLLVIIILIIFILILIIIIWNIINSLLKRNLEITELKAEIMSARISITDVKGDWINNVSISLRRGAERIRFVNETNITITVKSPADIVSVVDLSGSMFISEIASCIGISENNYCSSHPTACCCQTNPLTNQRLNCSKAEDCRKCNNGAIETDPVTKLQACIFHKVLPFECWNFASNNIVDYTIQAGCTQCGGRLENKCYWNLSINNNIGPKVKVYEGQDGWLQPYPNRCNASGGDEIRAIEGEGVTGDYKKHCVVNTGNNGRCATSPGHCLNITDCSNNNGVWNTVLNQCEFVYYLNPCCKTLFPLTNEKCIDSPNAQANCSICGGTFETFPNCRYKSGVIPTTACIDISPDKKMYFDQSMDMERSICEDSFCMGKLNAIRRIDYTKDANNAFIDKVFNLSEYHRMALVDYSGSVNIFPAIGIGLYNSTKKNLLNDRVNSWSLTSTIASDSEHQDTNICKALNDSRNILNANSNPERYKAIVLITDGNSNTYCNGTRIVNPNENIYVQNELYALADKIYKEDKIHIYTIAVGNDSDTSTLQQIANLGNGSYVSSDNISELSQLYNDIAYKITQDIQRNYEAVQKWNHLKVVFYNGTATYIYRIDNVPEPFETKTYTIPSGDKLFLHITNVKRIEIYLAVYTKSGEEIIGPLLDSFDVY